MKNCTKYHVKLIIGVCFFLLISSTKMLKGEIEIFYIVIIILILGALGWYFVKDYVWCIDHNKNKLKYK